MRVPRPKNELTPFEWQRIYDVWQHPGASIQEMTYTLMAEVTEAADLPKPKRYRGLVIAEVPQSNIGYFTALFEAQFLRAWRKQVRREKEQEMARKEALRRDALRSSAEMREIAYLRRVEWEREHAGEKPPRPKLPPGYKYFDDDGDDSE
jgi:hypothetical protein